jgi:hypothetical protein
MIARDMANIAYTEEYLSNRKKFGILFSSGYFKSEKSFALPEGYSATTKSYAGKLGEYHMTVSETAIFDPSGAEVYRFQNMDDGGEFLDLIRHGNGHFYLLFRIDLYGYGVYDLSQKTAFFHVPKEPETFIWTDVHYNPGNDMLAVGGCFWACPNGVHLLSFKNPMKETPWVDVIEMLDGDYNGYDTYDGMDFERWDGNTLIVKADELSESNGKTITMPKRMEIEESRYLRWLDK